MEESSNDVEDNDEDLEEAKEIMPTTLPEPEVE